MPYTQRFGLSRKSPFNVSVDNKEKKEEAPASEIIEKNNKDSFKQVGTDIFNQVKDKFQGKSTLGKLGVLANAVLSKGKSLAGLVDTSKLDQDRLDEAQDYVTIGSGAIGATGFGQPASVVMDIGNAAVSGKRAFDNFRAGNVKKGFKGVKDSLFNLGGVLPVAGEYQALQKGAKYTKKGLTGLDRFGPEVKVPASFGQQVSTTSFPMKISGKIAQMLSKMGPKN
tara:strand:+ start:239 stop:913 length:675 start_codon:yes stop_codon:yes gene_type:complete